MRVVICGGLHPLGARLLKALLEEESIVYTFRASAKLISDKFDNLLRELYLQSLLDNVTFVNKEFKTLKTYHNKRIFKLILYERINVTL